jgi:3-oxoacyl-[acyl-carrier protein] reductase
LEGQYALLFLGLVSGVALNYNTSAVSASEVKSEIQKSGGEAFITKADICKESEIIAMVKNTVQHFDRLDILVNCAGIMPTDPIETMSLTSWNNVITPNLTSCFLVIRESLPDLKKSTCPRIINIGSQAAFTGSSQHAHYAASKSGLLGLTYSLAKNLGLLELP